MKSLIIAIVMLLCALKSWATDPSNYVGVWQSGGSPPKTVEIMRDGDSFLLTDLRATDFSGKKQAPMLLSMSGPQLAVNTGFGAAPLGLSGDMNTLYFDKWVFKRVSEREAQRLKTEINTAHVERQVNQEQCKSLGNEFEAKGREISRSSLSAKDKITSQAELKRSVVAKAEKIPGCKATLLLY